MSFLNLSILTLAAFGQFALAKVNPHGSVTPVQPKPKFELPCTYANNQFGEVIALTANLNGDLDRFGQVDGRENISKSYKKHGLTKAEAEQIASSSCYVSCPGTVHDNKETISCTFVESNMTIVTNVHAFIDKQGRKREPLGSCYVRPQANPSVTYELDFESGTHVFGVEGARSEVTNKDYAVVRLKKPVPGVQPLSVSENPMSMQDRPIAVAAYQQVAGKEFDPNEPIIQDTKMLQVFPLSESDPSKYYTNADVSPMASGGSNIVRENGKIVVKGIMVSSGASDAEAAKFGVKSLDGEKSNIELGSYTTVIGTDGVFADALANVLSGLPKDPAIVYAK